jgi:hypothetical protein
VEKLIEVVYQRFQSLQIEPLTPSRLESLVRSARRTYDIDFCQRTISKLSPSCRTAIDALLCTSCSTTTDSEGDSQAQASLFHYLNSSPGRVSLNSLLSEISKLQHLRRIELPDDLFTDISAQVLQTYAARAAMEYPSHLRAHPEPIRYTLVAAFCWLKSLDVTDNLVDLLISCPVNWLRLSSNLKPPIKTSQTSN